MCKENSLGHERGHCDKLNDTDLSKPNDIELNYFHFHNPEFQRTFRDGNLISLEDVSGLMAARASPTRHTAGPQEGNYMRVTPPLPGQWSDTMLCSPPNA